MKPKKGVTEKPSSVYLRIRDILESARTHVARSVNTTQVIANWLIGREIVEEEQRGVRKAGYGEMLLRELAGRLTTEFGNGYSGTNLRWFRQFYVEYPNLVSAEIRHAARDKSGSRQLIPALIGYALRPDSAIEAVQDTRRGQPQHGSSRSIHHAARDKSWQPGRLHAHLSWTHYRTMLRVDSATARAFYEIEAIKNCWSARELERQINSLLYERLALSKIKKVCFAWPVKGKKSSAPRMSSRTR